jgi:hypothetical protein
MKNIQSVQSEYKGAIDDSSAEYLESDMLNTGGIDEDGYFDSLAGDEGIVNQNIIRSQPDRIDPENRNGDLIKKYVLHEIEEEEAKPWWD